MNTKQLIMITGLLVASGPAVKPASGATVPVIAVGSWQTLQTNIAGTGAMLFLTNTVSPAEPSQFYRVGTALP